MNLSKADLVWNQAAMEVGGTGPEVGDVALSCLLLLHGAAMNGGGMIMQDACGIDPVLGQLVEAYIKDESLFDALEAHLAQAVVRRPDQQALWDLIYHAINHFDIDASIRANDPSYSDFAVSHLRAVVGALMSGSVDDVQLAARRYLGARLPGA